MLRFLFDSVLSASERVYRLLLFVYPPAYRREYGPPMIQAYRDLCRNSYRQRGGLCRCGCASWLTCSRVLSGNTAMYYEKAFS
jgi:hypothetical protein